jgi:hypothetical protein
VSISVGSGHLGKTGRVDQGAVPPSRVRLLAKPGCHLCDDARPVIARVCAELSVGWDEVDVTTDERLWRRFRDEIPVVLVDGRQHDFWRVDEARLRAALQR